MTEARNHHFISQCYLKGFTADGTKEGKLFAINIHDGTTFCPTPKNIGVERDFNRIEGLAPGELERHLARFESQVDWALTRIRERQSIEDNDDWNAVLNLIALFAVRNPRLRKIYHKFREDSSKMIMKALLATPERWEALLRRMQRAGKIKASPNISYEELKRYAEEGNYDVVFSNHSNVRAEMKSHDAVLQTMGRRSWCLLRSRSDAAKFVTTDYPVCLIDSDGRKASFARPIGFGTAGSSVIVSLDTQLAAVGTFNPSAGGVKECSPFQVSFLNGIICSFAERQIYASSPAFRVVIGSNREPITGTELAAYLERRSERRL